MTTRLHAVVFVIFALTAATWSQDTSVRHVSGRIPVVGSVKEMAADRRANASGPQAPVVVSPNANVWVPLATIPGAVIHDISFSTAQVGYAAAELGQVWKTTDGGAHWSSVMNLGFPYYWYGITALSAQDVVVSGFNDSNFQGVLRWSHDGGKNWTPDVVLTSRGWSFRVRFADRPERSRA
jgi:hypothetical protein